MPSEAWPFRTLGRPHLPPVMMLHGFLGTGTDWLPVARLLAGDFFSILPDLPGHGANTRLPPDVGLHFDSLTAGLETLLEHLDLPRAALVGYSLGGRTALYAALAAPRKVSALVLEGANPGLADPEDRATRAALDAARAARLRAEGLPAFLDDWYAMDLFASLRHNPTLLEQTKAARLRNDPFWASKALEELSPGVQPAVGPRLGELEMPVLLVSGTLDARYTALAARMGAQIARGRAAVVPQAGHNVHLEQPAAFAALLRRFLGQG